MSAQMLLSDAAAAAAVYDLHLTSSAASGCPASIVLLVL